MNDSERIREAARMLVAARIAAFLREPVNAIATLNEVDLLDRRHYLDATERFFQLGWKHVGDVVDVHEDIEGTVVRRVFISPDSRSDAEVFVARMPTRARLLDQASGRSAKAKYIGLATETVDGRVITTDNVEVRLMPELDRVPGIERIGMPYFSSVQSLVAKHQSRVDDLTSEIIPMIDLDSTIGMNRRCALRSVAYLKSIGFVDPELTVSVLDPEIPNVVRRPFFAALVAERDATRAFFASTT